MQMERVIQLAASLPDESDTQIKLTGTLIKGLWDSLQHPPLSYLGDENVYRAADGSNNVRCIETELCSTWSINRSTLTPEYHVSKARNGRHGLRKKCHTTDPWKGVPGS